MKAYKKKNSIFLKLLLPMAVVAILQSAVFLGIILLGGVAGKLDANAYDIFSQKVTGRRNELENQMRSWSEMAGTAELVMSKYQSYREEAGQDEKAFLQEISSDLISLIRQNKVNGAYFILSQDGCTVPSPGNTQTKYGISIRDRDPDGGYKNNGDLLIQRAPSSVATKMGVALDSWWESTYTLTGTSENDYFFQPILAAMKGESRTPADYRYWSDPYRLSEKDTEMISCSVPLFDAEGKPFGVLGIELSCEYIQSFLPSSELAENNYGVYVLAQKENGIYTVAIHNGFMYTRRFGSENAVELSADALSDECYGVAQTDDGQQAVACVAPINSYSKTSPFYDRTYYLLGVMDQAGLLGFSSSVRLSLILATAVSLALSFVGIYVAAKLFSLPVKRLVSKVRSGRGTVKRLGRVNIAEIDEMIQAVEELNIGISDSEHKISEIIRMSGLLVGTFEVDKRKGTFFVAEDFFHVMGDVFGDQESMHEIQGFETQMHSLDVFKVSVDRMVNTYLYRFGERWVRLKISDSATKCLGIAMDISNEMNEKRKIEYERDHDSLTELLNRRAFHQQLEELFQTPEALGVAAMVMMDVDNLKYVNDSFGHDCGDHYLRLVSSALRTFQSDQSLVARMSGDEFIIFFYGASRKEEMLSRIHAIQERLSEAFLRLPSGDPLKARMSGGIAWYPEDSKERNSLIKFADFAMFGAKKRHKGNFDFFVQEDYGKNRHLVGSVDDINRLIDEELVDFHFQPIVNVTENRIYAYEALMRPIGNGISGPQEALSLAKAIGSLYKMEKITWFRTLRKFSENIEQFGGAKLFLNSIPNQRLSADDFAYLSNRYGDLLQRLVVEITEEEKVDENGKEWFAVLQEKGVEIAIDDYGAGYNGQMMLLDFNPDYVKIDMSIVRGVQMDRNRQEVISSLVKYGKDRGIKVIAEGVETEEELHSLQQLGVEYVQGYVLQKPTPLPVATIEHS